MMSQQGIASDDGAGDALAVEAAKQLTLKRLFHEPPSQLGVFLRGAEITFTSMGAVGTKELHDELSLHPPVCLHFMGHNATDEGIPT